MNETDNKEAIEKIVSSKYFETLVDEQIRVRVVELYRRNKWILRALIVVFAIIVFFLGKDFYDINKQADKYQTKYDQLQKEVDVLLSMKDKVGNQLEMAKSEKDLLDKTIQNEENLISKKENMYEGYQELLEQRLQYSQNSFNEVKDQIEINKQLKTSIENSIQKTEALRISLSNLYENIIRPKLDTLNERTGLIEKTSSVRYLFAERSDRTKEGNEFRPATIKLPFSKDILKAVFHDVLNDENPKEVLVDFYLNNDERAISQSVFTESGGFYEQNSIQFSSTNKNIYEVIPVFFYLPPNPPLYRIPDFVVLKISLLQKSL